MIKTEESLRCYHCGEDCSQQPVRSSDKIFCCDGCKLVYELLQENNLCSYYQFESYAGVSAKNATRARFAYLDDPKAIDALVSYKDDQRQVVTFHLPSVHCSSCIWLLEHLYRLNPGILQSRSDFLRKEVTVHYDPRQVTLRQAAELLSMIGYTPHIQLNSLEGTEVKKDRDPFIRIAVAAFCFSNIMLLSFPEYFGMREEGQQSMQIVFAWLSLAISLPALLYSGRGFFTTAWKGLRTGVLNIDAPIALSIAVTFARSVYEIVSQTGAGYLDSMTGIILFMLLGRFAQDKTQRNLQFDHTYKSFFPVAVTIEEGGSEKSALLPDLKPGQRIIVRSGEIIPTDVLLEQGEARIDYSFVTGESMPVHVAAGERIYAGGKQTGPELRATVLNKVEEGQLASMWRGSHNDTAPTTGFQDVIAKYFSLVLILLAITSFIFWYPTSPAKALHAFSSVLIVACPCALLLAYTFTNAAVLRLMRQHRMYLRDATILYKMYGVKKVCFDKTGTLTNDRQEVHYEGNDMNESELNRVYSLVRNSQHPLSKAIAGHLHGLDKLNVKDYREQEGSGIEGIVDGTRVKAGNHHWVGLNGNDDGKTRVYISIEGRVRGSFVVNRMLREDAGGVFDRLRKNYSLAVLSGDGEGDRERIAAIAPDVPTHFRCTPADKASIIRESQEKNQPVAMIGDGLNDIVAFGQSDVAIAVTDDANNFSPACDVILSGQSFRRIPELFKLAASARKIVIATFILSLLYNVVGLQFAVRGELSPLIAAILMPISSISIILVTTGATWWRGKMLGLN
ncbi:MAG: heavy metal translocating P-type ATPase metal-binding domain-containing protein [Flavobacteriales bacterium]|nr:heavy metal translocating P-type ATPase metal-binding domain-containing protein [Flavobacteriales bacterium]